MIDEFITDFTGFGGLVFTILVVVAALLLDNFHFALIVAVALVLDIAVTAIVRIFYFKERPSPKNHNTPFGRLDASSFPSLHAMRASSTGILLALLANNLLVWALVALMIAGVCYSRIWLKKHDWSDLFVGVIIGLVVGFGAWFFV